MKCVIKTCEGKLHNKTYCAKHLYRIRKYGNPEPNDLIIGSDVWAQIKDYPNYFINEKGAIYSKHKNIWRILSPTNTSNGYKAVNLIGSNGIKKKLVHRLVAEAFIPNYDSKQFVNHKDGNKTNNNVFNLEWCTKSENAIHAYRVLGIKHSRTKLTKEQIEYIKLRKETSDVLAKRYGVHKATIKRVWSNKTHKSYATQKSL